MFKFFLNFIRASVFFLGVWVTKFKEEWSRPRSKQHKKVKITQVALKEGESYRLGECIVTLAKFGVEGKEQVRKKIEAINLLRETREKELIERGQTIMLMNPDELKKFQIEEWIKQRKSFNEKKFYENLKDTYQQEIK